MHENTPPSVFYFYTDTATTEIYTLSLHDALPISECRMSLASATSTTLALTTPAIITECVIPSARTSGWGLRSEEHTSELQSHSDLVCRLLLEKKKQSLLERFCGDVARPMDLLDFP